MPSPLKLGCMSLLEFVERRADGSNVLILTSVQWHTEFEGSEQHWNIMELRCKYSHKYLCCGFPFVCVLASLKQGTIMRTQVSVSVICCRMVHTDSSGMSAAVKTLRIPMDPSQGLTS